MSSANLHKCEIGYNEIKRSSYRLARRCDPFCTFCAYCGYSNKTQVATEGTKTGKPGKPETVAPVCDRRLSLVVSLVHVIRGKKLLRQTHSTTDYASRMSRGNPPSLLPHVPQAMDSGNGGARSPKGCQTRSNLSRPGGRGGRGTTATRRTGRAPLARRRTTALEPG